MFLPFFFKEENIFQTSLKQGAVAPWLWSRKQSCDLPCFLTAFSFEFHDGFRRPTLTPRDNLSHTIPQAEYFLRLGIYHQASPARPQWSWWWERHHKTRSFPPFDTHHKHPYRFICFLSVFQPFSLYLHFIPFHSIFVSWEVVEKSDVTNEDLCTVSNGDKEKSIRSNFIAPSTFLSCREGRGQILVLISGSLTNLDRKLFSREKKYHSPR